MKRVSILCAGLTALALAVPALAEVKPGEKSPDFSAATLSGEQLKLSSLRGKVVLLDFWASWCEPCKKELPLLAKMAPRLRERGIEVVAVNIDDAARTAESFLKDRGIKLTVVYDAEKKVVGRYEPPKMPTSFILDKDGVVRAVHDGFNPGDESRLEAELTALATRAK